MTAAGLERALSKFASDSDAVFLQRFFKTHKGGYAEGDQFLGIKVPITRRICKEFKDLPTDEIEKLLESPIHEYRLAAVIIMTEQCRSPRTPASLKKRLYELYIRRTDRLNNWDIVDVSCRDVVGGYLMDKPRDILYELAQSDNIWERRIAIVTTWQFIRAHDFGDTLAIAEVLMNDEHDLIHKAVGWMLREVGKRDRGVLLDFLDKHAPQMPRTMLRYAIEHLPADRRTHYMRSQ